MTQHVVHLQAWGRSHSPHKFMIVSAAFTGDDNDELAMAQFAAYPESVRLMLAVARRSIANSKDKQGLGIEWTMIGEDIDHRPFDHRVLQGAHDLVAGYFRFVYRGSSTLPFQETSALHGPYLKSWWCCYLRSEIEDICSDEVVAKQVVCAVVYANRPRGLEAEQALVGFLSHRYAAMRRSNLDNLA